LTTLLRKPIKGKYMYALILVVCLISLNGKCIPYTEDPPKYYETISQCEKQLVIRANDLIKALEESKEQGQMTGKCIYISDVRPA